MIAQQANPKLTGTRYDKSTGLTSVEYNNIFLVGGYCDGHFLDDIEVVSINGSSSCMKPAEYPTKTSGSVGTMVNGNALVCGGYPYTSACYEYDFDSGLWLPHITMHEAKAYASGVMLNDTHWWITGGYNGFLVTKSTELYNLAADNFSPFIFLPVVTQDHTILKLDETHFFLCCGEAMAAKSYILDLETEIWTETPQAQHDHYAGYAGKHIFGSFESRTEYKDRPIGRFSPSPSAVWHVSLCDWEIGEFICSALYTGPIHRVIWPVRKYNDFASKCRSGN